MCCATSIPALCDNIFCRVASPLAAVSPARSCRSRTHKVLLGRAMPPGGFCISELPQPTKIQLLNLKKQKIFEFRIFSNAAKKVLGLPTSSHRPKVVCFSKTQFRKFKIQNCRKHLNSKSERRSWLLTIAEREWQLIRGTDLPSAASSQIFGTTSRWTLTVTTPCGILQAWIGVERN